MADEGGSSVFQSMFKNFPIFTMLSCCVLLYLFWYATGGVERGEQRRAEGESGIFIEVEGIPSSFGNKELFGVSEIHQEKEEN